MFKMYKINDVLSICGAVYRVDADTILEYESMFDEEITKWLKDNDYPEGNYLICEYKCGKYKETTNVVFYYVDDESFVDCAERDFRVMGDVLNKPVANKYLYADMNKRIKEFQLEYEVADLIEDYFCEHYL